MLYRRQVTALSSHHYVMFDRIFVVFMILNINLCDVLEYSEITSSLPWRDAFLTGRCRLHSDPSNNQNNIVTSDIQINATIPAGDVTEAWVGMYATSSSTITFEGCRYYAKNTISTVRNYVFDVDSDPLGSCYKLCNATRFSLSLDKCYCLDDVAPPNELIGIFFQPPFCESKYRAMCGLGNSSGASQNFTQLCTYGMLNDSGFSEGIGDCLSYNVASQLSMMEDCDVTHHVVCVNDIRALPRKVSVTPLSWWMGTHGCADNYVLGNIADVRRYIPASSVNSYWINGFRRTFFSFSPPGGVPVDRCVAVKNNTGKFTLFVRDCNDSLPALCIPLSPNATTHAHTTTPISITSGDTSVGVTSSSLFTDATSAVTVSNVTIGPMTTSGMASSPVLWPLALVAIGVIFIAVVVAILCYRKRLKNINALKMKSLTFQTTPGSSNSGAYTGTTLSNETSFVVSGHGLRRPDAHRTTSLGSSVSGATGNSNMTKSCHDSGASDHICNDITEKVQETNPYQDVGASDDIYNELNEKNTGDGNEDVYDHTRVTPSEDNVYDGFCRSESLGDNGENELMEYDTMANINAGYTGNDAIYDTSENKPEVDLSDYDTTTSINEQR